MKKLTKVMMAFLLGLGIIATVTGCQTAEGFGEDMEDLGEEIQDGSK